MITTRFFLWISMNAFLFMSHLAIGAETTTRSETRSENGEVTTITQNIAKYDNGLISKITHSITQNKNGQITNITKEARRVEEGTEVFVFLVEKYFLPREEFDQKIKPFADICANTTQLQGTDCKNFVESPDVHIVSVPEQTAIVQQLVPGITLQFETTAIDRCVAVGAWNAKSAGLLHYPEGTSILSLKKFIQHSTVEGSLSNTHLHVVTNFLTVHLRQAYDYLIQNAKGCPISVDASHGGYRLYC